jgi:hypothetical protein
MFTKVVPKSKSSAANSPHFRKKNEGSKTCDGEKHRATGEKTKSTERSNPNANTNLRMSTKVELIPTKEGITKPHKKEEGLQRQKSQMDDNKHEKKEGLQRQKSLNGGHREKREELHKQKSHGVLRSNEEHRVRQDKKEEKEEVLQRQKSQSEKQKRDTEHKEKGSSNERTSESQKEGVQRQKSQSAVSDGKKCDEKKRASSHEPKNEFRKSGSREGISPNERAEKSRTKAKDCGETTSKHRTSLRQPQHNSHEEEAPSINDSMLGKSSTKADSGEKKHSKSDPTKDGVRKSVKHMEKSQMGTKISHGHNTDEKKANTNKQGNKRVAIRSRSLSPQRPRKTITADTKEAEGGHFKSLKERSKSVGHTMQRQRLPSEFYYVHQQPVSHVPKASTLSTYRSQFYDDVMAQSCLKSLVDKKLKI